MPYRSITSSLVSRPSTCWGRLYPVIHPIHGHGTLIAQRASQDSHKRNGKLPGMFAEYLEDEEEGYRPRCHSFPEAHDTDIVGWDPRVGVENERLTPT